MAAHPQPQRSPRPDRAPLQQLLATRADLWRGRVETSAVAEGMSTGFSALDQSLPWRGWPTDGLIEILSDQPGAGLALILPALARLGAETTHERPDGQADQHAHPPQSQQGQAFDAQRSIQQRSTQFLAQPSEEPSVQLGDQHAPQPSSQRPGKPLTRPRRTGWLLLVNPPLIPYAPALALEGLDLSNLLIIEAPGQGAWAMEQALRIGGCAAVIAWSANLAGEGRRQQDTTRDRGRDRGQNGGQDTSWTTPVLRRLQLAAQAGSTPAFLLRPSTAAKQPSPAQLRIDCAASHQGLELRLRKLRGGRAGERLRLSGLHDESAAIAR